MIKPSVIEESYHDAGVRMQGDLRSIQKNQHKMPRRSFGAADAALPQAAGISWVSPVVDSRIIAQFAGVATNSLQYMNIRIHHHLLSARLIVSSDHRAAHGHYAKLNNVKSESSNEV